MLDFLHLPPRVGRTDIQFFKGTGSWQTWRRPRGASMVYILCIGGGAAGGRGVDGRGGGGGGGGSGGHSRCLIQAGLLPDTLFVKPGWGGPSAGGGGNDGEISYVSISQSVVANNVIARSGAVEAKGGAAGVGNAGGGGGAGETIVLIATMPLAGLGHFDMIAGRAGSTGGSNVGTGVDIAFPTTSCITTGGCGGGGASSTPTGFRGGEFTAVANTLISERRPASNNTAEGGSGPPPFYAPLYSLGGQGGAGGTVTDGGNGGTGINGSGGGGSGAGGLTFLGGRGGDGGNGLVIIASW